jgi:hypothetical protein
MRKHPGISSRSVIHAFAGRTRNRVTEIHSALTGRGFITTTWTDWSSSFRFGSDLSFHLARHIQREANSRKAAQFSSSVARTAAPIQVRAC